MEANFIGNTIIYIGKPYQVHKDQFNFFNLDNFVSKVELDYLITSFINDSNSIKRFSENLLENINETNLKKWADFSDLYTHTLEDYLTKLSNEYHSVTQLEKIPLYNSPIISISEEAKAGFVYGEPTDVKSFHFPEEGIGLFTELAKLELFDLKGLIKFANIFGLPVGVDLTSKSTNPDIYDMKRYNTLLYFGAAPITRIYGELTEYQNIFNTFIAVKTQNGKLAKKIRERKLLVKKIKEVSVLDKDRSQKIEQLKNEYEDEISIEEDDYTFELSRCRRYLSDSLTKKVAIYSKIVDTIDGNFTETILYNNLFDIAYNQIKLSLINNTVIKKCEHCGHFFESKHGKQRFCPPLPFRKRSSCENSYNQIKAKLKQKGE